MKRFIKAASFCSQIGRGFVLVLVAGLTLATGTSPIRAATYYVSPNGNDAASGTIDAPWKSVAKVNAAPLRPGDSVLFSRGGCWRESLGAPTSGTSRHPILFGDYGTGTKPQFLGGDPLDRSAFFPQSDGVFAYRLATRPGALLTNHNFVFDAPKSDFDWWEWKEGLLLLRTKHDPRRHGPVYDACLREDLLNSNGHEYLVFRNLACDESAKADGGYGVRIMDSSDVLVQGCEVRHAGKHHFASINSTRVTFQNCVAELAMPHQGHGATSAYVAFGDNAQLPKQTARFENCSFQNTQDAWDGANNAYIFITHGPAMGEVTLQNLTSQGAPWELDNRESKAKLTVNGGWLENNRLELYGSHIVVDGLHITGPAATVDISASDCLLQNMTITGTNLGTGWYQTAVLSRGANNTVNSCHIALASDAPDFNTPLAVCDSGTPFSYSNNTLISRGVELKDWTASHTALILSQNNTHRVPVEEKSTDATATAEICRGDVRQEESQGSVGSAGILPAFLMDLSGVQTSCLHFSICTARPVENHRRDKAFPRRELKNVTYNVTSKSSMMKEESRRTVSLLYDYEKHLSPANRFLFICAHLWSHPSSSVDQTKNFE